MTPVRKMIDHRGPLLIDVRGAWYFITICAEERVDYGRAVSMKPPPDGVSNARTIDTPFMNHVVEILDAARFRHLRGLWKLALFLVMPDHIHLIAHFPDAAAVSTKPPYPDNAAVSSKPPYHGGMEYVISDLKRWLSTKYGIRFQRNFFDTRLRDDAHYAEKFKYICRNPVRKGLCETARDWPHVIAFDRETGEERKHQ